MRCFVAVAGKSDLGGAIDDWLGLTRERFPELAVTPAVNLHLTLAFMGEIDEGQVDAAGEAVVAAAGRISGFDLGWGVTGAFPGWRGPRVLWLGVGAGGSALEAAHDDLVGELAARGLPVDSKRYRPHLTLARVRKPPLAPTRIPHLADWLAAVPPLPPLAVDSIVLYRSTLGRPAAVHTPVRTVALRGLSGQGHVLSTGARP